MSPTQWIRIWANSGRYWRLPRWHSGKEPACQCRRYKRQDFNPWLRKIPWSRKWQPTPVFLPGKFHGQSRLAVYIPWGHKRVIHDRVTEQASKSEDSKGERRLACCSPWGHRVGYNWAIKQQSNMKWIIAIEWLIQMEMSNSCEVLRDSSGTNNCTMLSI